MSRNVVSSYTTATLTPPVITRRHRTTATVTAASQEMAVVDVTERKSTCLAVEQAETGCWVSPIALCRDPSTRHLDG